MAKTTNPAGANAPAELTLEQAVAKIATLEADKQAAAETIATLETAAKDLEKAGKDVVKELQDNYDKLKNLADAQASELEDAATVVEDLKAQLKDAGDSKGKGPIVTIGKEKFRVVGGTIIKRVPYTPADIASNKELAKVLIAKGSTLLKKIS